MVKSIFLAGVLFSNSVIAGTHTTEDISSQQRKQGVINGCCDSSMLFKYKTADGFDYSKRLDLFSNWLCSFNKPCNEVQKAVLKRYNLFLDTVRWNLETGGYETWGNYNSVIKVVMYISLGCPLCKKLYNELIDSLSVNPFGKNVSVTAVPFTNSEPDRLYTALSKWEKQNALLRALYPLKERVTSDVVLRVADSLGIDSADLLKRARSSEIINITNRSRETGIAAGVKVTPTFFVNNIKYKSYKDIRWVMDYLEVIVQKLSP